MPFNPALGREQQEGTVDGFVSSSGLVWDNVNARWVNKDGTPADLAATGNVQEASPAGSALGQVGAIAAGIAAREGAKRGIGALADAIAGNGLATTAAENVAFNAPALEASNIAFNAPSIDAQIASDIASGVEPFGQVGAGTAAQTAGSSAGNILTNTVLPGAGVLAGALGLGDLALSSQQGNHVGGAFQGGLSGLALGSGATSLLGLTNPITAPLAIGGLAFGLAKSFEGGKSKDQKARDSVRDALQGAGLAIKEDGSHKIELADGTLFDIGRDGGSDFQSFDGSKKVKAGFEVDDTNPLSGAAIGLLNPLFSATTGLTLGDRGHNGISALINGVVSNANGDPEILRANVRKLYADAGLTREDAFQRVTQLMEAGKLSAEDAHRFQNGINQAFGRGSELELGLPTQAIADPIITPTVADPSREELARALQGGF